QRRARRTPAAPRRAQHRTLDRRARGADRDGGRGARDARRDRRGARRLMLVTAAQMRELDRRTIELGTPGEVLMERAGAGIAAALLRRHRAACARGVVVVSGRGNNGGDGFVVARLLKKRGHRCEVVLLGRLEELEGDARLNAERWTKMRGRTVELETLDEHGAAELERRLSRAGVVVDGIFGTGLARP